MQNYKTTCDKVTSAGIAFLLSIFVMEENAAFQVEVSEN